MEENFSPQNQSHKILAIASLVLGILAVIFSFMITVLGIILGALALVFGNYSKKIPYGDSPNSYTGIATAGFVLGIIALLICVFYFISCASCSACQFCLMNDMMGMGSFWDDVLY